MQRTLVPAAVSIRYGFPGRDYGVIDMNTAKGLIVSTHDNKSATIQLGLYVPSGFNLLDLLRKVVNDKSTRLPDEVIDGRKVSVFRAEYSEQVRRQANACPPMKVWVDPETKLPIRIEAISQDDREPWTMYDLAFDQPLDPCAFQHESTRWLHGHHRGIGPPAASPARQAGFARPEIIPGVGLGRVKFGTSKENVIKIFGKPDVEEREYIGYPSRGYGFYIASQSGVVVGFTCLSQQTNNFRVRDFAGKTKEGIGIGSSLKDLENAFGKPDNMETEHLNTYFYDHNLGLRSST